MTINNIIIHKGHKINQIHKQNLYIEQIESLYSSTNTAVLGTILSSVAYVYIFSKYIATSMLLEWLAVMIVISVVRYFLNQAFKKRKNNDFIEKWGNAYIYLSFVVSSIWGLAWFTVIGNEDIYGLAIVGMFAMGISATPFSAYVVFMKALLFFFMPLMVLITLNYIYVGGIVGYSFALSFVLYTIAILRSAFIVNNYIVVSILNGYKLEDEIQERKKVEAKLLNLSIVDDLTGLYNRRYLNECLSSELSSSSRTFLPVSFILIDIDNFKNFNDNYGHINGDNCLSKVSQSIKDSLKREQDLCFRFGGEELAVILPNTKLEDASVIAEQIRLNIINLNIEHKYSDVDNIDVLTISIGVASIVSKQKFEYNDFIDNADHALYKAKLSGRNKVVNFNTV